MNEIVIVSGKGGTGKTTVTAAFAALAASPVIADCDVDAADLHLVLSPTVVETNTFYGGQKARVLAEVCSACGECLTHCRFDAVRPPAAAAYSIDEAFCEGCGVCARMCPEQAIVMEAALSGEWYRSTTRFGTLLHARLAPAEENSGKLVSAVRREARVVAEKQGASTILIDGPPGAGCPAIAAITGASFAVIVTEPTVSGYHDLTRIADLAGHFGIPAGVVINKADLNRRICGQAKEFAATRGLAVLGTLPYDPAPVQAQIMGKTVMELPRTVFALRLETTWRNLTEALAESASVLTVL